MNEPELKVVTEGLGGTVYIVTASHNYQEKGKRGYVASIGVGEDCYAKTPQDAVEIAHRLAGTMASWRSPDAVRVLALEARVRELEDLIQFSDDRRWEVEKTLMARLEEAENVVGFYADPESYFAVLIMGDSPCGDFADDIDDNHSRPDMGPCPGKLARDYLRKNYVRELEEDINE